MSKLLITCGNFFFRHRNNLFPLFMVLAALLVRPTLPRGSAAVNNATDLLGAGITLFGQFIRIFTIGYKYIKRGGKNKQVFAETLVQEGVFAHCRNPMYAGNLLIFLGITVMVHSPLLYVAGLAFIGFVYASIIAAEEKYLRERFGAEFDRYCERVPRLFFTFRGFRASLAGQPFQWRRVVLREFGTVTGTLVALIAIRCGSLHLLFGAEAAPEIRRWCWALPVIAVFYLTAYVLKKTHILLETPADPKPL